MAIHVSGKQELQVPVHIADGWLVEGVKTDHVRVAGKPCAAFIPKRDELITQTVLVVVKSVKCILRVRRVVVSRKHKFIAL